MPSLGASTLELLGAQEGTEARVWPVQAWVSRASGVSQVSGVD